jgi:hypothetical protein
LLSEEISNNPIDNGMDLGLSDDFHTQPINTIKPPLETGNIQPKKAKPNTDNPPVQTKTEASHTNSKTIEATEKPPVNHVNTKTIEANEAPHANSKVIDYETNKVETLRAVVEQEVLRVQTQKQQALEAKISDLKQRLVHQSELEKQFVEQNQYIQTIQEQQAQQSEKLAKFINIEQEAQAYIIEYDKQIAELKQTVQQQQASEQAAQEYAIQQQKVMEETIQKNADLQAEQVLQQSKIAEYQTQIAQAEAKIKEEYQVKIAQAEFPVPAQQQLHVSATVIDAVTKEIRDTEINQSDYNQSELDIDKSSNNQFISKSDDLYYADNIPVELRKDLAELLPESTQHAQKLLDIFSAQLSNPNQPIQNPIVDFAHLVQRLQIGELNIEDTETLIARARGDKTPQQYEFERLFTDLEEIRHTAELNKQHYLEYYQRGAEDNHISVEEYIEDQDQMEFWQELCSTLKQSECAIRDLMAQDTECL